MRQMTKSSELNAVARRQRRAVRPAQRPIRPLTIPALAVVAVAMAAGPAVVRAQSADAAKIDAILTQLEKRSDGLKDISCKIRFEDDDQINLAKNIKIGTLKFMVTDTNPRALVHFDRVQIDGTLRKQEWYLFDGRFWYEAIERLHQVTKREIVHAHERFNPFDLETAPFPMPFGQKKSTILRNFDVSLIAPGPGDPTHTDHLRLVPKPGSKLARKYDRVDYYVLTDLHLPSLIVATRNDGMETVTVKFIDLSERSLNTGLTEKDFQPPAAWKGYQVVEEPLDDAP